MPILTRPQAEDILYEEARRLDEHQYDDWFAMLTLDVVYWVPCNGEGVDPRREVSLVYDDHARLRDRLSRLGTGLAHAQQPASRTRRLISNVQLDESAENRATIASSFLLYELRQSRERIFAGHYQHRLRYEDDVWKIVFRKAILANNDEVIDNLTFIV